MKSINSVEVGTVLIYHTCESFDPITHERFGEYDIHYLVKDIIKDNYYLFNLDTSKFYRKMPKDELIFLLHIKTIDISEEVA